MQTALRRDLVAKLLKLYEIDPNARTKVGVPPWDVLDRRITAAVRPGRGRGLRPAAPTDPDVPN